MPQIPLPQTSLLRHADAQTPISGNGLKLHYYGDNGNAGNLAAAAKKISKGLIALDMDMADLERRNKQNGGGFASEVNAAEDRLAAAEDRALFSRSAEELQLKLAENPGADDKTKEQWIADFQKKYQSERASIVARMSERSRKLHDIDMLAKQNTFANQRRLILYQGKVTRLAERADALYTDACDRGKFDEAERLIREISSGPFPLLSPEVARHYLEVDLPRRKEYFEAKNLVNSDPDQAVMILEDKNNYSLLSSRNREQLIRAARAKSAENTTEYLSGVIAQMNAGTFTGTPEEYQQLYKTGQISQAQFNAVMPYVKKYEAQQLSSQNQAKQQEIRLSQLRSEDKAGAFVYNTIYGPDGSKRTYSETDLAVKRLELFKLADGNRSILEKYLPKLNSALAPTDAAGNPVTGSKRTPDFWKTPDGEIINKWITAVGKDNKAYRWDPDGWEDSDDWSEEQKMAHHLRMELQYRQLAEILYARYGNTKDVTDTLTWAQKELNGGTVSSFLQWRERNLPLIDKKLGYDRTPAKSNRPKAGDK